MLPSYGLLVGGLFLISDTGRLPPSWQSSAARCSITTSFYDVVIKPCQMLIVFPLFKVIVGKEAHDVNVYSECVHLTPLCLNPDRVHTFPTVNPES